MKEIKFRINEFYERPPVKQFSEYEDEFQLCEDPDSKDYLKLVKVGQVNCQEAIQSYEDCALNKILDKYLDQRGNLPDFPVLEKDDSGVVYERKEPDLADLGAEYERMEKLKEKYGLDDSLGYDDVIKELQSRKVKIGSLIDNLKKQYEEKKKNEKTQNEPQGKQEAIQK